MTLHHLVLQVPAPALLDPECVARIAEFAQPCGLEKLPSLTGDWGTHAVRLRDIGVDPQTMRGFMPAIAQQHRLDWAVVPAGMRLSDFKLIALDMDGTLVAMETIDELGAASGKKAQIATITEAAMRGEMTEFSEALRRRLAILAGTPECVFEDVYARLQLNPGAEALLEAARTAGLKTMVATGGFTWFTDRLKTRLQLNFTAANVLEFAEGKLTGHVIGSIVDAAGKRQALLEACATIGCAPHQAIAIGDGANDLGMMAVAGLSVAYHGRAAVKDAATLAIDHAGLDALLRVFED
jgi:phosphoserine phosphatase